MKAIVCQIDAFSGATPVTLRVGSHDDEGVCHLDGETWLPAIGKLPTLAYDLFDGAFEGQIVAPTGELTIQLEPVPTLPGLALHDARLRLWRGNMGAAWSGYSLLFDGRVTEQPSVADGAAKVAFGCDDAWLDEPLLATYAGTGGAEGATDLAGNVKPLLFGAVRFAPGVLVDAADNIYQLSDGSIDAVEVAFDKVVRFGAASGDHATFAALKAATIPPGSWATCLAGGYVRLGAPAEGTVSFHVRGSNGGSRGFVRRAGSLIHRIAELRGQLAKVNVGDLDALDAACPWDLSPAILQQTTPRALILEIAQSVNAVPLISWTGQLRVKPVTLGSATGTLASDGSALPPVASVEQIGVSSPWWRLAQKSELTARVHNPSEMAIADPAFEDGTKLEDFKDAVEEQLGDIHQEIEDLQSGATADVVTGELTKPSFTLRAYADGNVINFAGASGTFVVRQGNATIAPSLVTFAFGASAGLTGSIDTSGNYSVTGLTADNGSLTMTATYAGVTVTRVFQVARQVVGYEIIYSPNPLPTTNLFEGRIVFLESDGKLYRYHAGAWTKSVSAPDISGQLIASQIADGAIGLTKFASSLSPVTIWTGGSLPTSYQGAALTWGGKLYRWTGSAYVANVDASDVSGVLADGQIANLAASKLLGQITATQIADGGITTPKLATNAVTADKVAANQLSAQHLTVGTLSDNLVVNPRGQVQTVSGVPDGWYLCEGGGASIGSWSGWLEPGRWGLGIPKANTSIAAGYGCRAFPVTPGRKYYVRLLLAGSSATPSGLYLRMNFRAEQPADNIITASNRSGFHDFIGNGAIGGWTEHEFVWTCPSSTYWASFAVYNWEGGPTNLFFSDVWVAEQTTSVQIGDGSILAPKIAAGQVNATHIGADQITAVHVAAGAISTAELAAGAVTTNKLAVVPESILPDAYFRDPSTWQAPLDPGGWFFEQNTGSGGAYNPYALGVLSCITLGPQPAGTRKHAWGPFVPFSGAGQVVRLRARGINNGPDWMHYSVQFLKFDGSGNGGITASFPPFSNISDPSGQVIVPEGTAFYRTVAFNAADVSDGTGKSISAVKLDVAASAEMIVDGSVTAAKILAGSITGDRLAVNTITAGNIAGEQITTDKLAAGAVTAAKVSVTSLSALTAIIGTLRTASAGARTEIKDNLIEVYDWSNVRRVRMGVF